MRLLSLLVGFASLAFVAALPPKPAPRAVEAALAARATAPPAYKSYYFDQPIDHFPHSPRYAPHTKATFKQRYVFDSTYYKPGGPVYLYISGETSVESRFSNLETGIIQILMEATNGLGVILENRYYGESWPFQTLTTDELAYLTQEQTIADNAYFAQRATFPGVEGNLTAPGTPWIFYGGSLAGAETAFSLKTYGGDGGVLFGGIASSGTTKAILAYPQWYNPIQKYGPQDCAASINAIVDKMDALVKAKNTKAIDELKTIFGLGDLQDIRDFAATIAFPLGGPMFYPTNTWQELNWYPAYTAPDFFDFCSNVTNIDAPANVTAVDSVLAKYSGGQAWMNLGNYAEYIKRVIVPLCEDGDINSSHPGCFGTQNATYWADTTLDENRSYVYTTCVEQGGYLVAQPTGPSLVSRVLQLDYTQQWCTWSFPPGKYNKIPATPDLDTWNKYGGYAVVAPRLAHIDGATDVWLDLCYHSNLAPGGGLHFSSDLHPEYLINGAGHHWDSYGIKDIDAEPQFIRDAHLWEIKTVKKWLRSREGHSEL